MAALIHFVHCVYSAKKWLANYKICAVNPPALTFLEFYKEQVYIAVIMVPNRHLKSVFVGKLYTSEVDQNLTVVDVSHCFKQVLCRPLCKRLCYLVHSVELRIIDRQTECSY